MNPDRAGAWLRPEIKARNRRRRRSDFKITQRRDRVGNACIATEGLMRWPP